MNPSGMKKSNSAQMKKSNSHTYDSKDSNRRVTTFLDAEIILRTTFSIIAPTESQAVHTATLPLNLRTRAVASLVYCTLNA